MSPVEGKVFTKGQKITLECTVENEEHVNFLLAWVYSEEGQEHFEKMGLSCSKIGLTHCFSKLEKIEQVFTNLASVANIDQYMNHLEERIRELTCEQ